MILKRLIEILKTFDKDELKKFGRFIRSDYFNTNQRVTELFKALKIFYPLFENAKLTNEFLFKQIYGARKFDDKTFRYLLAELLELAEKFIALTIIEDDKVEERKNLISGLLSRMLFGQAKSLLRATEEKVDADPLISGDYLEFKIDYYQLWHHLLFLTNKQEPLSYKMLEHGDYLTIHNLIELFHLYHTFQMESALTDIKPDENVLFALIKNIDYKGMLDYLDKLDKSLKKTENRTNLIRSFKIYLCYMITSLDEKDETYFDKMRDLVNRNSDNFDKEELQNLHVLLLNLCNHKMRSIDHNRFLKNYFEITKSALSKDLLAAYQGQYMSVAGYYRIFEIAITLREFEWAEYFVGKYANKLSPEYRKDSLYYSEAELCFWNNRFEEALNLLSKVKFSYPALKLNVRTLTLRLYYELNHIEEAYSLADSFAHLLSANNKINSGQKTSELNFIFFLRKLLKLKDKPAPGKAITALKNEILSKSPLNYKEWLLSKTEEFTNAQS